jgi:Ni/Co efflux regulator RcnB
MLKTTLYGAVAGGVLAAAATVSPLAAAPATPAAPQVEKNVTDVQHRHWRRHHRHHHHRYYNRRYYDGYYYGPNYYRPGPGIYFRAW